MERSCEIGLEGQEGGDAVDAAHQGVAVVADALGPQEAPGLSVRHQVEVHEVLGGIEVGPVGLDHQGPHGVKALVPGLVEIEAGAGDGQIEGLQGEGADDAVEGGGTPGQIGADDPSLTVGERPRGEIDGFAGDEVVVVDAVAAGVNVGVGGLEARVDHDAAPGGDREARLPGQLSIGDRAHRNDDQVGR